MWKDNSNTDTCNIKACWSHHMLFIQVCCNGNIFANEELRLDSFKNWPQASPVGAAALANAGFFYVGESAVCPKLLPCCPFKPHIHFMILGSYLTKLNNPYFFSLLLFLKKKIIYLFRLRRVLDAAHGIFIVACGIFFFSRGRWAP